MQALSRSIESRPPRQREIVLRAVVILALAMALILPLIERS